MTTYNIKGINDESDTCSHCGKTNLKRVVWLAEVVNDDEMEPMAVGTDCAARLLRGKEGKVKKAEKDYVTIRARIANSASKWLRKGYSSAEVARGITAHFGFQVDRRQADRLIIGTIDPVIIKL